MGAGSKLAHWPPMHSLLTLRFHVLHAPLQPNLARGIIFFKSIDPVEEEELTGNT